MIVGAVVFQNLRSARFNLLMVWALDRHDNFPSKHRLGAGSHGPVSEIVKYAHLKMVGPIKLVVSHGRSYRCPAAASVMNRFISAPRTMVRAPSLVGRRLPVAKSL